MFLRSLFLGCLLPASLLVLNACSSTQTTDQAPANSQPDGVVEAVATRPIPADTLYDLLVAEVASNRANYPLALENYTRQAFKTRDLQVTARATYLALQLGALDDARRLAELWLDLDPDDSEAHYIYSATLSRQREPGRAFYHMEQVRRLGGQTAFTHLASDSLGYPEAKRAELLQSIDQALLRRPDDVELLLAKGIILQKTDKEAALEITRKARGVAPNDAQVLIQEATLLHVMDRHDDALHLLSDALIENPQHHRMRLVYARLLTQNNLEEAKQQFEILLSMSPGDPELIFDLGVICRQLEQYAEATAYFEQLLQSGIRQSDTHFQLAILAAQQGNKTAALAHFKKVSPGINYLPAMTQVARFMLEDDQASELGGFLAEQRQRYPQASVQLVILEADILIRKQKFDAADTLLNQAIAEHPESTDLLYTRSLLAEKQGNISLAEADLRRLLKFNPDNGAALNALGYILTNHSERYTEALSLIRRALTLSPEDPTVLDSMGWVKYHLGDLDAALGYLEQAYHRYPDPEIAAHLGEVLWQLNQPEQALKIWREGMQADGQHEVLIETIRRFQVREQLQAGQ